MKREEKRVENMLFTAEREGDREHEAAEMEGDGGVRNVSYFSVTGAESNTAGSETEPSVVGAGEISRQRRLKIEGVSERKVKGGAQLGLEENSISGKSTVSRPGVSGVAGNIAGVEGVAAGGERREHDVEEAMEMVAHLRAQLREERAHEAQVRQKLEVRVVELSRQLTACTRGATDIAAWWREYRTETGAMDNEQEAHEKIRQMEHELAQQKKATKAIEKNAAKLYAAKEVRARELRAQRERRELQETIRELQAEATERAQANQRAREKARAEIRVLQDLRQTVATAAQTGKKIDEGQREMRASEDSNDGAAGPEGHKKTTGTQTSKEARVISYGMGSIGTAEVRKAQKAERAAATAVRQEETMGRKTGPMIVRDTVMREGQKKTDQEIPSWARVAKEDNEQQQRQAIWKVPFESRVAQLGEAEATEAMLGAVQGKQNFQVRREGDLLRFDYDEPWPRYFVHEGRGDTVENKAEWRRAWLRREMRGIVVRRTGQVVVRGLHKFFNLGQLREVNMQTLQKKKVVEVLEKLDGQMIVGVVVGEHIQFWSRKGLTTVSTIAMRVAQSSKGEYEEMVRKLGVQGYTAVFELVGAQSKIKADEGMRPRLVMIAVREHATGKYLGHEEMLILSEQHGGVEVVTRMKELEEMDLNGLVDSVKAWHGREGVVTRFDDGTMVKIKSRWWFKTGHNREDREQAKQWRCQEQERQVRFGGHMQTRAQRVAMWGMRGLVTVETIKRVMPEVKKIEMVYKRGGKLSVIVASFEDSRAATRAIQQAKAEQWQSEQAYSRRTNKKNERFIEVFRF